jgi:DNA-binding NtrC family response regulator
MLGALRPAVHGIPPLRERFEDLPELLVELLARAGAPAAFAALGPADIKRLEWHDWHSGNVRELANHVSRAVMEAETSADVPAQLFQSLFGLPGEVAEHLA